MAPPFNEAQLAILEDYWRLRRDAPRPPKRLSICAAMSCSEVGPEVTSQAVGRYFSNRAARERGQPRARAPTRKQLRLLEEAFDEDAYPYTGTIILLTYQTGLQPKQVKSWFDNRRRRLARKGEYMFSMNFDQDPALAATMWRDYQKDPEAYAREIFLGMRAPSGEWFYDLAEPEDEAEWDRRWSSAARDKIKKEGGKTKKEGDKIKKESDKIKKESDKIKKESDKIKKESDKIKEESDEDDE
ncbi:hypothetical protein F4779DRAFT_426222 [Xylariaceae sp. FL0662B]|nr:hypothetical protein F4779DRAFT_426222 [Xylariaceae sp. FL0662B]